MSTPHTKEAWAQSLATLALLAAGSDALGDAGNWALLLAPLWTPVAAMVMGDIGALAVILWPAALLLLKPEASEQPLSPLDAAGIVNAARRAVFRLRLLRLHWLVVGVVGVAVALRSD